MLYNVFIWFLDQENIGLDPHGLHVHTKFTVYMDAIQVKSVEYLPIIPKYSTHPIQIKL